MNSRIIAIMALICASIILCSCKKLVEVDGPATSVSSKNVYNNDATAIGAITSLYVNLSNGSRAESKTRLGRLIDAISDVDQIRNRAGLGLIHDISPTISKENLLNLILKEKRIEFFTEWGHRWLDLKRTGKVDEVMAKVTPKKSNGSAWRNYQQYYPIWSFELQSNLNLIQNQGY